MDTEVDVESVESSSYQAYHPNAMASSLKTEYCADWLDIEQEKEKQKVIIII